MRNELMFIFLCKQKTAYDLRIRDWSSDMCSSDLDGFEWPRWRCGLLPCTECGPRSRRHPAPRPTPWICAYGLPGRARCTMQRVGHGPEGREKGPEGEEA